MSPKKGTNSKRKRESKSMLKKHSQRTVPDLTSRQLSIHRPNCRNRNRKMYQIPTFRQQMDNREWTDLAPRSLVPPGRPTKNLTYLTSTLGLNSLGPKKEEEKKEEKRAEKKKKKKSPQISNEMRCRFTLHQHASTKKRSLVMVQRAGLLSLCMISHAQLLPKIDWNFSQCSPSPPHMAHTQSHTHTHIHIHHALNALLLREQEALRHNPRGGNFTSKTESKKKKEVLE